MLSPDGVHRGLPSPPSNSRRRQDAQQVVLVEPRISSDRTPGPGLKIKGRRLDAEAPALAQPWVTNAHVPEFGGWTMLTMLELPPLGCWEVTASRGGDRVSFVVWVARRPPR